MSMTDKKGSKIVLDRAGRDAFWDLVADRYAEDDPRKWRYLAMLALRENAQWSLELIGKAFGHHRGHVTRCLTQVRMKLRQELGQEPNIWGDDQECLEVIAETDNGDEPIDF